MYPHAEHPRQHHPGTTAVGATSRLSPVPFERIDDYVVVARLGQGGMAEVFLALSVGPSGFRKLVAIKRLHKHMQHDAAAVDLFLAEASLAARLQHSNVVQTHKVGTFQGQHFIAMEYLDGQPLNRVLNRLRSQESRLPAAIAAQVISDALEGLHYAHDARDYDGTPLGIIHRDVSPHNIFVTFDGQVKLLDFGIARVDSLEAHGQSSIINGKFAYMAPEQALGEYSDRRADIWGMGITLWECLAGQRLFRGCNDVTVMQSSLTEDIPWVTDIAPEVPEPLARIVDKALQRDPDRRFNTALSFKEELDRWLATQRVTRSRVVVSTTMRSLFSDAIERRRGTLRECLARVDGQGPDGQEPDGQEPDVAPPTLPRPGPLAPSLPPPLPMNPRRRSWVVEALPKAGAFAVGAVLALLIALIYQHRSVGPASPAAASRTEVNQVEPALLPPQPQPSPALAMPPLATRDKSAPALAADASSADITTLEAEAQDSDRTDRASARQRRKQKALDEASAVTPPVFEPEPVSSFTTTAKDVEERPQGRLLLDSTPYAVVSLDGKRLGITPIDVELPAATHTLLLRNPERGIETTYLVTVPEGDSIRRRVVLD